MALLLTVFPQKLIAEIGHDGSDIVFPDEPEPLCRRGFYVEEINVVLLKLYNSVLVGMPFPGSPAGDHPMIFDGILLGKSIGSSADEDHAVCWKAREQRIYDPNGANYKLNSFNMDAYYALIPCRQH